MPGKISAIQNNLLLEFFLSPHFRTYRHVLLLALTATAIFSGKANYMGHAAICGKTAGFLMLVGLFYANMYVLVPKLLFRNKYVEYGIAILTITVLAYVSARVWTSFMEVSVTPDMENKLRIGGFLFAFAVLMAASAAVKLFQRWVTDNRRILELEKITVEAELEQLKTQINPHFLFNMLNNANVLTRNDPGRASQVLVKLSKLLRYQLYDCARNHVLLTADIAFLGDLLSLEKIRRDDFEYSITTHGETEGIQVPPLLFVTFVENAVKHGIDGEKPSYINVHFEVVPGKLHFTCTNSKPRISPEKKGGGLGLANVKRRLELIYGNDYMLKITDELPKFNVSLKLGI